MRPKRDPRDQPESAEPNGPLHVSVDQLEAYFKAICDHIRRMHGNDLEIDLQYYWDVSPDDMSPDKEIRKPDPTLGDLFWDMEHLESMLKDTQDPSYDEDLKGFAVMKRDFQYLAAVLDAIAAQDMPFAGTEASQ